MTTVPADAAKGVSPIETHYRGLLAACETALTKSLQVDGGTLPATALAFANDLHAWMEALGARRESILLERATREYQHACLSACLGQYRQAFASLRLFLELSLASIYYSANELQLREWLNGKRDNSWRRITKRGSSVTSTRFAAAFAPELTGEVAQYATIASKVYRECSEFVHGNLTALETTPKTLTFDEPTFREWHARADSARLVVTFFLALRYLSELEDAARSKLEGSVLDQIGHIGWVRAMFHLKTTTV